MTLKHLHVYRRSRVNKNLFECEDPECTHFTHRKRLYGKKAKCRCGQEFILGYESLRRARPSCHNCSGSMESKRIQAAFNVLEMIEKEKTEMPIDEPNSPESIKSRDEDSGVDQDPEVEDEELDDEEDEEDEDDN